MVAAPLLEAAKVDDPVGVIPVHFLAALWALVAVGLFGEGDIIREGMPVQAPSSSASSFLRRWEEDEGSCV